MESDELPDQFTFGNSRAMVFDENRLSYVGQDCKKIPPVLAQLYGKKVHYLDLSYNTLISLQGIEKFCNLEELVLDNNCLSDSVVIPMLPRLQTLSLNKNNINNLELLLTKISRTLPKLNYLSLLGNLACPNQLSDFEKDDEDYQRYRYYVIYRLPGLKFLDSKKISAEEKKEAEHRGQFMKIVRPGDSTELVQEEDEDESNTKLTYTPLPSSSRDIGDHQGAYGRCRYRYSGKHSEGNRFIQNHDL